MVNERVDEPCPVLIVPTTDAVGSWLAVENDHFSGAPNTISVHRKAIKVNASAAGPRCRRKCLNAIAAMNIAKMIRPH
jgi:hypothetical protein